jgi:hypothetical protein
MAIDRRKMTQSINGKVTREPTDTETQQQINFRWWKLDGPEMANAIAATVRFIDTHSPTRREQLTASTRLYGNSSFYNLMGTGLSRGASTQSNPQNQRVSYNLCQSVIDTKVCKVAKNKVIPVFITNGGDWDIQQKAQKLSKFIEGSFYENKSHKKGMIAYKHAEVWGTGISHIFRHKDRVCEEVAYPHEFFVDQIEAMTQFPRQLHRVKIVDRDVLQALFPDQAEKIQIASPANFEMLGVQGTAVDLVPFIESWHLPSDCEAPEEESDGLHSVIVGDQVLEREWYNKDFYPFAFLSPSKRLLGFWGQGACERLQSLQGEINRLMILIQRSMWMGGSFKVLLENGSKVVSQHLNNDIGAIIHYTGTPPQYITPPMIQQDIYPYVDALIAKGYQQEGISQLQASSMKPPGLDSGKAMRAYIDNADDRMLFTQQEVEDYFLEKAALMIDVTKDIFKDKNSYEVMFPTATFVETIDWKDIQLDKDQFVIKAFPVSSLRDDYAGRLSDIQEGMQAGLISPRTGRKLMQMPDVEMADNLANAAEDLLHRRIESILEGKEYVAPEPTMDLALAKELCLQYMNYAQLHNCPEDRLDMLRNFMNQINVMTGAIQPPQPMSPVGPPQAQAAPPPVSNLIPNAPVVGA